MSQEHFLTLGDEERARSPHEPALSSAALPLSEAERDQLLAWNNTARDYPRERCIHHLFEAAAGREPSGIALVAQQEQLSYEELNRRANQLAHYLRALGVGPEVIVGICLQRSVDLIVSLLAVLKAGGAYLPLDPKYPQERLSFMLDDAAAAVLLTEGQLLDALPPTSARVVCLESEAASISRHKSENPGAEVGGENLCYVLYTSGSTGKPKGVAIQHGNTTTLLYWAEETFAPEERARVLATTSISFDLSVFEVFVPLSWGGTVILGENALTLGETPAAQQATLINTVPSAMVEMLQAGVVPASARTINLAGEPLKRSLAKQLAGLPGTPRVLNLYGPTEATTYSTFAEITDEGPPSPPIGHPIAGTQVYILDEQLQLLRPGIAGELCIGGDGLARGYLNRPELTAERFVPNPHAVQPGARLYKTGDLGRYLPDGSIEFLGRLDHQVKLSGYRIELGEIEATLETHPLVRESVVVAHEYDRDDRRLVAYFISKSAGRVEAGELRAYLRDSLPEFMIPATFVELAEFPLTPNRKVDRRALPAPAAARQVETPFVAPATPVEQKLAGIWAEVLKLERVGVDDDFFALGGNSLLATQVIARVQQDVHTATPLRTLFAHPTVSDFSRALVTDLPAAPATLARAASDAAPDDEAPLSFVQQRMWLLQQMEPDSGAYNIPLVLYLKGTLDRTSLARSLQEITRRHEVLRAIFPSVEGQPVQRFAPAREASLEGSDLRTLRDDERERELQSLIAQESQRPFDLARGPLFRTALHRLTDDQHVLLVTMHHIVGDGWSEDILIRELATLYEAYLGGQPSPLPDLPIQYADFARWQRTHMQGEVLQRQLRYWKRRLADAAPVLDLPTDLPRPPVQTFQGRLSSLRLSRELTAAIRELGQREAATLFMTLLAAFKALLHLYTGQRDISIGSPISGRLWTETENLIGLFLNTLVLRTDLSGDPSFKALLQQTREVALGAYEHQDVPFELLLNELPLERDLSHTPLFQVVFNMLNYENKRNAISLPGLTIDAIEILEHGSKFDLTLYVREQADTILLNLAYNADLFEPARIEWLLVNYRTLLEGIVLHPERALSQFPLMNERDWHSLSARRNEIKPDNPFVPFKGEEIEQTIGARFAQQVLKYPHRLAVKTRTHQWTYEQLNRSATQVAHTLVERRGAEPERVALLFKPGAPMLAALLGTLQAGKTYVPLDVTYPRERLAYILKDAQAGSILTDSHYLDLAQTLSNDGVEVVNIDEQAAIANPPDIAPAASPESVAYLLYTSGSTGEPKGVMQNHRNVLHHISCYTNSLHLCADDRLTLLASYSFDAAVMDIFGALLNGATLYPLDLREGGLREIKDTLVNEGITIYHSTPTLFRHFAGELGEQDAFPQLRLVVLGGEEAIGADIDLFKQRFPAECLLVNGFGPTESTVTLQCFINHDTQLRRHSVPVGYPVEQTEVSVLGASGARVPPYVIGEIAIRSEHLALGYWRNEGLTNRVFLPDPADARKRTYLTGDLGRVLADGSIEFRGRKDAQTKIRGYRIELAEIEVALRKHQGVREAVVLLHEESGAKKLVAYFVPEGGSEPGTSDLRAYLKEKLPEYMVPSAFIRLDEIVLTPNGKVDRRALPALDQTRPAVDASFAQPRTPEEEKLAAIWRQVLRVEQVGVHDNFFELGGDSLTLFLLLSRMRDVFAVEMTARSMFERPTVAEQAELLQTLLARQAEREQS